jgi:hypothetical protein
MGLGIVLLFWGIVGAVLAGAAAVALAGMAYLFDRRRRQRVRRGWLVIAAVLPFVSLAYAAAGFVAYGAYCELVRDVDMGIGDSWRVPVTDGYRLIMIDTPDQAFLEDSSGRQLHYGLKRIGAAGHVIAGEDEHGLFAIDAQRHTDETIASESALRTVSTLDGSALIAPADFYDRHRWSAPDAVAGALIVAPPFLLLCVLAVRFVRTR